MLEEQSVRIEKLSVTVEHQSAFIRHLKNENKVRFHLSMVHILWSPQYISTSEAVGPMVG